MGFCTQFRVAMNYIFAAMSWLREILIDLTVVTQSCGIINFLITAASNMHCLNDRNIKKIVLLSLNVLLY
jgi:hypothetical protein